MDLNENNREIYSNGNLRNPSEDQNSKKRKIDEVAGEVIIQDTFKKTLISADTDDYVSNSNEVTFPRLGMTFKQLTLTLKNLTLKHSAQKSMFSTQNFPTRFSIKKKKSKAIKTLKLTSTSSEDLSMLSWTSKLKIYLQMLMMSNLN